MSLDFTWASRTHRRSFKANSQSLAKLLVLLASPFVLTGCFVANMVSDITYAELEYLPPVRTYIAFGVHEPEPRSLDGVGLGIEAYEPSTQSAKISCWRYDRSRAFLSKSDKDLRYFVFGAPSGFYSTHPLFPGKKKSSWPVISEVIEPGQQNYVFETKILGQLYYLGDFIVAELSNSDSASPKGSSFHILELKRDKRQLSDFLSFAKLNTEQVILPKLVSTPIQEIKGGNPDCGYFTTFELVTTSARSSSHIPSEARRK